MNSARAINPFLYGCILFSFTLGRGLADEKPTPADAMIDKYLAQETAKLSQRFLDGATTLQEWQARRPRLKQEYLDMLGLWPLPEKTPLHVTCTGTVDYGDLLIDKLHYQSRPGLYVTGNLYRPKKAEGKLPAVLYVCGHSGRGRDGNKTAFQDHGMWFASNGYICLVLDTLQLGEIPGIHHGTYSYSRWWWQARGYTPAGVECWNGIRGIDYLLSRPDVDPDRIAVTGISGGGASTFWIAAADDRVRCAVPVSGMSDLESYVSHKVINGHCDCMFLINSYGWEWTTIAALIAPRPMLFCNSDHDSIFPMDGNKRIIERLRKVYAMYGKPELVDDYVSHGGHDYRPDLRVAIFKWINKHMKGETGPVKDADFKPLPGKELRVFAEDKDIPADAINGNIDESFVPLARVRLPQRDQFAAWKKGMLDSVRSHSFRTWPYQRPLPGPAAGYSSAESVCFPESEPGITVRLAFSNFKQSADTRLRTLYIVKERNPDSQIKQPLIGREGFWLTARGTSNDSWTKKSPPNYVERAHALLGRTADQGRVWDVRAAIAYLDPKAKREWKLVGWGQGGILAAYAALFEPSITEIVVIDPPTSHRDGPIFLNVLRVLDIPDALGLLAPKKLTLINAKDKAFDRTVQIYKLASAEDKLTRK
jgi:cephalosporin-C deacetylase-like acetyl esterase